MTLTMTLDLFLITPFIRFNSCTQKKGYQNSTSINRAPRNEYPNSTSGLMLLQTIPIYCRDMQKGDFAKGHCFTKQRSKGSILVLSIFLSVVSLTLESMAVVNS